MVSDGDTVVLVRADDFSEMGNESREPLAQGMLGVGLSSETGEPWWEMEQEFADEVSRAESALRPGEGDIDRGFLWWRPVGVRPPHRA